jgi:Spx/MgsR family transcriptional regulator
LILYGIPHCTTVKKARAWLDTQQVSYTFHDLKKAGVTQAILARWMTTQDWNSLLNKRGTTWRQLTPEEQMKIVDQEQAIKIMLQYPSLIKRPVLELDERVYIGFAPENYKALFL